MKRGVYALTCLVLALASLQQGQARPARALLQTASSEAEAASWVTANLTGPSPNVQAASTAVAQAASLATSSGSSSSVALATAFVNVLLSADGVTGNATANAFSQALSNTKNNAGSRQVIAQAYSSAILSLYKANQIEAASTAVAAALLVGQDSTVVAANAAAFASSNATAIAIANISAIQTPPPGVNCLAYSKAYADAVTSVITASPIQVSAAASAVAAAFAQGCSVERAVGLALTEAIYNLGCGTVGPVLLSAQAYAADTANSFGGSATAFAAASARYSVVRQCLFNATIASDATARASATAAATAIAQADASAATNAITGAICNSVTATATAQAFAQAIATGTGCNGVIYQAISTAYASSTSTVTSCGASSATATASAKASASLFFDYPAIASCRHQVGTVKPNPLNPEVLPPTPSLTPVPTPTATPSPTIDPNLPLTPGIAPAVAPTACFCTAVYKPVCGKNGQTYSNAVCAGCANVEVVAEGVCEYEVQCKSTQKASCFVDPCQVNSCPSFPSAVCLSNYCESGQGRINGQGDAVPGGPCSAVFVERSSGKQVNCNASGMAPQAALFPMAPESAMAAQASAGAGAAA